jgi:signal transduction histidine kinase
MGCAAGGRGLALLGVATGVDRSIMVPDPRQSELQERIRWLIFLRWLAAGGVAGAAGVLLWLEPPRDATHPALPVLAMGLLVAAYNVLFLAWQHRLETTDRLSVQGASVFANVQIVVDLFALAALLHFSGGVENPFSFFFVFHMIIASILLTRRAALAQALLASALYAAVVFLEEVGILPHVRLAALRHVGYYQSGYAWVPCFVLTLTLLLSVVMATSITERLREREQQAASLIAEVQQKAAELEHAYAVLEAAQRQQTQYMRRVAHELRAPLGAIASLLSVVSEGLTGQVPAKQLDVLRRAESRLADMLRLVNDLLTLSRSQHGALTEHVEPVDVGEVITNVVHLHRARAEAKRISTSVDVPDLMPPVCADAEGLTQVMTNLVANAIKYTPSNGQVSVSAGVEDDDIVVRVRDTGIGIPSEDLPRVFDEFFRSRAAREYQRVGTGLGLAIAQSIVAALDGSIEVESRVGEGTEFCVRLPVYRGDRPCACGEEQDGSRTPSA